MTNSAQHPTLNIETRDVTRQFDRRLNSTQAEFLQGEIAQRMFDRLNLIKLAPQTVLDAGCGSGRRIAALMLRYPNATRIIGQDLSTKACDLAAKQHVTKGWRKILGGFKQNTPQVEFLMHDLASSTIAPESVDLVWSNLALHWHPEPHRVLNEWGRILKAGGLAFFSSYGPGTLIEVREAIKTAGLRTESMPFVDMHDFGDLLIESGFADPVMDQETLTLTYKTGIDLLKDISALGGNAAKNRQPGLVTPRWREKLIHALEAQRQDTGLIHLTIEVAYGHAWRSHTLKRGNETRISLDSIKRSK
jgi:malonyl-CoA O-methyltransferase